MEKTKEKKGLNVNVKSFITAIAIIFGVMVVCYVLTFIIPAGQYLRNEDGTLIEGSYKQIEGVNFPFYKWILAPFLNLGSSGGMSVIFVCVFLLIIGGIFNCLNRCGLMKYMVEKITAKFGKRKYVLMGVISFFFMAMGSVIGSFEEIVPLVPIIVSLSIGLGWDTLTGLGMSLLSIGSGFAAGVCNPFTIGVAQQFAGLPMFSGFWLRAVSFVLIFCLLYACLYFYAKKIDRNPKGEFDAKDFENNPRFNKAFLLFGLILGIGIICVFLSAFISFLQDYTMVIISIMFLVAGVVACVVAGVKPKPFFADFLNGVLSVLPAVLMVLMASSVKFILEESCILDTILNSVILFAKTIPAWLLILFIYLFVLIMNFFIASGSAKAAMLIPLIIPVAQSLGLSPQLCILAFAFGDGFSNVFYPTNPVLLISLGITDTSYGKWVKYSWKYQLLNLILTCGLLLFGFVIGY